MEPERRASRAGVRLRRAATSPCPHCGRTTKTVDGVCADCWGQKEGEPRFFFRRTQGSWVGDLLPLDWWPGPALVFEALVFVAAVVGLVVYALTR